MPELKCKHNTDIESTVNLSFIEDIGRYTAEVRIRCVTCGKKFKFLGMPIGLDYNSAAVSFDGLEARLAVAPEGDAVPSIDGVVGYTIRNRKKGDVPDGS